MQGAMGADGFANLACLGITEVRVLLQLTNRKMVDTQLADWDGMEREVCLDADRQEIQVVVVELVQRYEATQSLAVFSDAHGKIRTDTRNGLQGCGISGVQVDALSWAQFDDSLLCRCVCVSGHWGVRA